MRKRQQLALVLPRKRSSCYRTLVVTWAPNLQHFFTEMHSWSPAHQYVSATYLHLNMSTFCLNNMKVSIDFIFLMKYVDKSHSNHISWLSGLFWRIHQMELLPSLIFFVIITGISTYLMALAYKNTKFTLKHKVANKREDAVTREVSALLADKKMSRKEKDERYVETF